jgi:hypothetical protein
VQRLVHVRTGLAAAAVVAGIAALPTAPAAALDDTKPEVGCAGLAFSDPAGDAINDFVGLGLAPPAPPDRDITGGFFRFDARGLTANMRIADLPASSAGEAGADAGSTGLTGVNYYFFYRAGDRVRFVDAAFDGGEFTYHYGTFDENSGLLTNDGDTRGKLFPGANGIIQIEVPAAAGGATGTVLASPYAEVDNRIGVLIAPADQAPDSLRGESYTVGECVEGSGLPPGIPPTMRPAPRLPVRAPLVVGSARRANSRKVLTFRVRATKTITNLRLALRRSDGKGKAFAAGGLKRLRGTRTVRLRVRRQLMGGVYSLQSTGTVAGKRLRRAQQVRVRR